ncbi:hypothetical protein AAY473_016351 [Plecturocebus cupreus]
MHLWSQLLRRLRTFIPFTPPSSKEAWAVPVAFSFFHPTAPFGVTVLRGREITEAQALLQYQCRLPFSLNACAGLRVPVLLRLGKRPLLPLRLPPATAVATVRPPGPGRGTAQPEYQAPRTVGPERTQISRDGAGLQGKGSWWTACQSFGELLALWSSALASRAWRPLTAPESNI